MFSRPFQYFTVDSYMLPDFIGSWVSCWLFFGIPSLAVIFGLSYLPIFRRRRWQSVTWQLPLLGLLFGLAMGYFNAWGSHQYDAAGGQDHWYYLFGVPGNGMAESYGGDWQSDEAWDYRSDIAIWNGLFWVSVATVGAFLFRFVIRRHTPNKSPEPTAVGACSSAVAVHVASRRWLSFFR